MIANDGLRSVLVAWREIVGPDNVLDDAASRGRAETATFHTSQRVPAIVRPGSRAEVQSVLRIANQFRVPVYPISRGKNWAYGSGVPIEDACVVDLSRMNRIVAFDEALAYVSLEPGVTVQALYDFLRAKQSRLMMSVTGSTPDTSIVGNILERGVAVGPYGDRAAHVCALEVVLPTGECASTGFANYRNAASARIGRWGVGPALDGLFMQSNLGVVTEMTMWLRPRPAHFQTLTAVVHDDRLEALVDALRELALEGTLQPTFGIWNDYKLIAATRSYPWNSTGGRTPLPDDIRRKLTRGLGGWVVSAGLYSNSARHAAADKERVAGALAPITKRLLFLDEKRARLAKFIGGPVRQLTGFDLAKWVDMTYHASAFLGVPSNVPMRQAYWRKRMDPPERPDPDRDRCGIVCCSPALPFEGTHARTVVACVEEKSRAYGFEPNITLLCITPRQIDVVAMLIYDRDVEGDDQRALECHAAMMSELTARGYPPYRLGVQSMTLLPAPDDDTMHLRRTLKRALDPNDILAPGRYDLRAHWNAK